MLRIVGAGLPRTGTKSLQTGLELLLDGRCYHMHEVFAHPEHVPFWRRAFRGEHVNWPEVLGGYVAAVDWPVSAVWRELSAAYPASVVLLSVRDSARTWWESMDATILPLARRQPESASEDPEWREFFEEMIRERFTPAYDDPDALMAAYERHNAAVRDTLRGTGRLIEWRATDGWEPLCAALGVAVPEEPFPHTNTRDEWGAGAST